MLLYFKKIHFNPLSNAQKAEIIKKNCLYLKICALNIQNKEMMDMTDQIKKCCKGLPKIFKETSTVAERKNLNCCYWNLYSQTEKLYVFLCDLYRFNIVPVVIPKPIYPNGVSLFSDDSIARKIVPQIQFTPILK